MNQAILPIAYVRLSGEDERTPGTMAEKFARLTRQCIELARAHGIALTAEQVIVEPGRASGQSITKRPGLMRLLENVRAGCVTHVVTPYQDRLTRGSLEDEAVILRVFTDAGITLIIGDGPPADFGALRATDELMFGIRRALGRWYARDTGEKREKANQDRYAQNKRCAGRPPYGYARDLAAPGGYATVPGKYEVACEVLERGRTETMRSICLDLERRGVLSPGGRRRWLIGTVRKILGNLFYAGYHSRSFRRLPNGNWVDIRPEDRIVSGEEGKWIHPIDLSTWHALQEKIAGTWKAGGSRGALLTGVLRCAEGSPMCKRGPRYACTCGQRGAVSHSVAVGAIERYARGVVTAVIEQLPLDALETPGRDVDRLELARNHQAAVKRHAALQGELDGLVRQAASLGARFSTSDYERVVSQVTADRDSALAESLRLGKALAAPDVTELRPLLLQVLSVGMESFWCTAADSEQRALIRAVVERFELRGRAQVEAVFHSWIPSRRYHYPRFVAPRITGCGANGHWKQRISESYVSTREVASRFGVTAETVRGWCVQGRFPGAVNVGVWMIPGSEVETVVRRPVLGWPEGKKRWEVERLI